VVPHLIGPGCGITALGGTSTLRGVGCGSNSPRVANGFDWFRHTLWVAGQPRTQRTASLPRRKNNLYVLPLRPDMRAEPVKSLLCALSLSRPSMCAELVEARPSPGPGRAGPATWPALAAARRSQTDWRQFL